VGSASSSNIVLLSLIQRQEETIKDLESANKEKDKTILHLESSNKDKDEIIKEQEQTILSLQSRIAELGVRLHSGNSSLPPSRDMGSPRSPRKAAEPRSSGGRKAGGQKGREGKTRLFEKADKVQTIEVGRCTCGRSLLKTKAKKVECRHVVEIVLSPIEITEYRAETKECPECSCTVSAPFPKGVENPINFGLNIKVLILYLRIVLFTPYKKIEQFLQDFYGLEISPATIEKTISTASKALDPYDEEIRRYLLASPILHADETGCRVLGKRWWLHCLSTPYLTYYWVHKSRGAKAMDAMGILPYYMGILVHDFWAPYAKYKCYHAYCNAHLIRELQGIYDVFKHYRPLF